MSVDWGAAELAINQHGYAVLPGLVSPATCNELVALYDAEAGFRSCVVMARHGYGQGEYKYFAYDLPPPVQRLRTLLYPKLAAIANGWARALSWNTVFPDTRAAYLAICHAAGQKRPTPLLLRYGPGDYNCLHQDLYGELVFPLQVAVLLRRPAMDFEGGEFVLVEQRPRRQSRAEVVPLAQGDAVVFAVNHRPVQGARVVMRHGVSRVRAGQRYTLGIIFHDAK